jgi:hypothetical protein
MAKMNTLIYPDASLTGLPNALLRSMVPWWFKSAGKKKRKPKPEARRRRAALKIPPPGKAFIIISGRVHREGRRQGHRRDEVILPLVKPASLAQRMGGWPQAG